MKDKNQEENTLIIHKERGNFLRLNKFISETGICSRREADKLIEKGRITVNGNNAKIGAKIAPEDKVKLDGKTLTLKKECVYLAFNKPRGITCTTENKVKGNIIDFINYPERIFPIGRLDKDSEGLIFLTNDGDIVNKILRAGNNHEKEYIVTVNKPINTKFIDCMSSGIKILGTVTNPCWVKKESKYVFRIILTQGLNRQIRRMCGTLGYEVIKLQRIRIMNVSLGTLPIGQWRDITKKELITINKLITSSVKTEDASN